MAGPRPSQELEKTGCLSRLAPHQHCHGSICVTQYGSITSCNICVTQHYGVSGPARRGQPRRAVPRRHGDARSNNRGGCGVVQEFPHCRMYMSVRARARRGGRSGSKSGSEGEGGCESRSGASAQEWVLSAAAEPLDALGRRSRKTSAGRRPRCTRPSRPLIGPGARPR